MEVAKTEIFNYCLDYVHRRIASIQEEMEQTQRSANEETKSSAGDKYETGRAMAQLGLEMNGTQLHEAEALLTALQRVANARVDGKVIPGAVVETSQGRYYVAISIGRVEVGGKSFYAISPNAPIAGAMMGKCAGECFHWQGKEVKIESVA